MHDESLLIVAAREARLAYEGAEGHHEQEEKPPVDEGQVFPRRIQTRVRIANRVQRSNCSDRQHLLGLFLVVVFANLTSMTALGSQPRHRRVG